MLASQPMASNSSGHRLVPPHDLVANSAAGHRSVEFHHLGCACRHAVASKVAEVLYLDTATPDLERKALKVLEGHEAPGWYAKTFRVPGRDQWGKTHADSLAYVVELQQATTAQLVAARWAKVLLPRRNYRTQPAASTTPMAMYCRKCCVAIHRTPMQLVDAAQRHPGQRQVGGQLIAYLADRGEVVYRIDDHAEQLAVRDRRAQRAAHRAEEPPRRGAENGRRSPRPRRSPAKAPATSQR